MLQKYEEKKAMTRSKLFVVVLILVLGLLLRLNNYSIYPQRGASADEYTYSFLGVSLLTTGVPVSWSFFTEYKNLRHLTIEKLYFPIVYPYFDHPPLNGIVVGGWALLFGENSFEEIKLSTIRLVPISLSMASSVLVFLLALRLYNYKTAIWALLIYSTTTIFVMNQRVVFAENLLTPILLLSIYIFVLFYKKITIAKALILGLLAGLAFWTKEVGIAVFISTAFLFLSERLSWKFIILMTAITGIFVLGYVFYGYYYDWEVFTKVIQVQSNRIIGPQTLQLLTTQPVIVNKVYYDGWYFLGFLSIFISFMSYQKHKMLLVPAATYFMLLIFSLHRTGEMGWYMIPLFPFMAILSANLLVEGFRAKFSWTIFLMLLFVGFYQIQYLYEASFGLTPIQFRIILFVIFAPVVLAFLLRKEKIFNILSQTWFYILILGNIYLSYNYVHPA